MPEILTSLSPLQWMGAVGVVGLVGGWLVTSFRAPGAGRDRAAWLGTLSMYLAFLALFSGLFLRAHEAGSLAGRIGFGFLACFFLAGLGLSATRAVRTLVGRSAAAGEHAVH